MIFNTEIINLLCNDISLINELKLSECHGDREKYTEAKASKQNNEMKFRISVKIFPFESFLLVLS